VRLVNGKISVANPTDQIEGISVSDILTDSDNTTNPAKKYKVIYKPVRLEDTRQMIVVNGTLQEEDVGLFFDMDYEQNINYDTINSSGGQFRLESILATENGTIGEFSVVRNLGGPA
jgi:hypothetical protein